MIVADVNTVAYLLINGDKTALAQQIFQKDNNWCTPPLWRHEFLNVLATLVRRGSGEFADMEQIWHTALHLFSGQERAVDPISVLRLAYQSGASAYDAQYIALAQEFGVPCVTEDSTLANKFPTVAYSMQVFWDNNA
ncbi:type II toxin-antitoxin system VapC family toxin [soil metagenome]